MARAPKLIAFGGSIRQGSHSAKLLSILMQGARDAGAEVTEISLRDYPMPLYDGDLEASDGVPAASVELHRLAREHDGYLISSTEYNGGVTPLLKNTIDWLSRAQDDQPGGVAFRGKSMAIVSATAGMSGGWRMQGHLRQSFQILGMILVPETATVPFCDQAFDENGEPKQPLVRDATLLAGRRAAEITARMIG